jgi:PleD family two-component response regulator
MKKKVLIADKHQLNIQLAETVLKKEKFDVVSTNMENNVFEIITTVKPDVVLLDVSKDDNIGFDILEQIKNNLKTKEIPVIIYSVYDYHDMINKAYVLGADDYCVKPIKNSELVERVKKQCLN